MPRESATLNLCGITQYINREYWDWTDEEFRVCFDGKQGPELAEAIARNIERRLTGAGMRVEALYAIIHDKDEREVWDELKSEMVTAPKPVHVHAVVRFKKGHGGTIDEIAAAVGVDAPFVEKAGRGSHAYDNMLSYLPHIKYEDKHQYPPEEVVTIKGPDFQGIYAERREAWLKGRAAVKKKRANQDVDHVEEQILLGEIVKDQLLLTDELFEVYARNKTRLDQALEVAGMRRAARAAQALRKGEFSTTVLYITGRSGVGKTSFAMDYIRHQQEEAAANGQRWDLYRAATSNPLDDWQGQEIILLDDLRASAMTATEWLLLLDPYNASPASARYRNKADVAPRLIVITASIEPVEFFFYVRQRGEVSEALDQFIRRLSAMVRVVREDELVKYELHRMGKTEPYVHGIRQRNGDVDWVRLNYGSVQTATVEDADVIAGELVSEVARRSNSTRQLETLPGLDWEETSIEQHEEAARS